MILRKVLNETNVHFREDDFFRGGGVLGPEAGLLSGTVPEWKTK